MDPSVWLFATWLGITILFTVTAVRSFVSWHCLRDTMILFIAIAACGLAMATSVYALIRSPWGLHIEAAPLISFSRVFIANSAVFFLFAVNTYIASHNGHRASVDKWREPVERYFRDDSKNNKVVG